MHCALLLALPALAEMDSGKQFNQSRDEKVVRDKCPGGPLCFDRARELFVCCSDLQQRNDALLTVRLSLGTSTTVSVATCTAADLPHSFCTGSGTGKLPVKVGSVVTCGCRLATATFACANDGRWVFDPRVNGSTITDGSFVIKHGYALGGEIIVCRIE